MTRLEFLLYSFETKLFQNKLWLIRTLSILMEREAVDEYPTRIGNKIFFMKDGEQIEITDATVGKPLFDFQEPVKVKPGMLSCIKKEMDSSYFLLMHNAFIIDYPFEGLVEYINEKFTPKNQTAMLFDHYVNHEDRWVKDYERYVEALGFLSILTDLIVPTVSENILTMSEEAIRVRDRLIKENEGKLDDPIVVAEIDKQIQQVLHKELEGDEAKRFYISGKSINKVRKMTHGMIGAVPRLDDPTKVETIPVSLEEGWQAEHMPALVNNSRAGSFDRGKDTALGGEAAKNSGRSTQNILIGGEDCGVKVGVPYLFTKNNYKRFITMYVPGSAKPLDEASAKALVGKTVQIRTPGVCNQTSGDFCARCLGDSVAKSKIGVGSMLGAAVSTFTAIFLASFHGKELKTRDWDFNQSLS